MRNNKTNCKFISYAFFLRLKNLDFVILWRISNCFYFKISFLNTNQKLPRRKRKKTKFLLGNIYL